MKRQLFSAASAGALALSLLAAAPFPAAAQGVQALQDTLAQDLVDVGINPDNVEVLTLRELLQIENILNSGTANAVQQRMRIEQVLTESGRVPEAGAEVTGVPTGALDGGPFASYANLRENVQNDLNQLGLQDFDVDVDQLTVGQLGEMKNVLDNEGDQTLQRERIQLILQGQ